MNRKTHAKRNDAALRDAVQRVYVAEALERRVLLAATPQLVKDVNTTPLSSNAQSLVVADDTLFFIANDGRELWKSDGTTAGTVFLKRPNPDPDPVPLSYLENLTSVNGTLFFTARDGEHGRELWKSDGTEAGTVMVKDINPGGAYAAGPGDFINFNGALFFRANDGIHGDELWMSNGTEAGTVLVKDIKPVVDTYGYPQSSSPTSFAVSNGTLFFVASDEQNGRELWKSNGTEDGTVLVKDINPGSDPYNSYPRGLTDVNGTLFFTADDGEHGEELWKSNGTEAGTVLVKDVNAVPSPYGGVSGSSPTYLTNVNGTLFFAASDGIHAELWKSNGTEAGTTLVKDILPGDDSYGPLSSLPRSLTNVNGTLFFTARDETHGIEVWKSNGIGAGTVMVADIGTDTFPNSLFNLNGTLYFSASDDTHGSELWKSNGTVRGTKLVKDINPNTESFNKGSYPFSFANLNGTLFFAADDGAATGRELWRSNGTASGTRLVKDARPGTGHAYLDLANVNGTLFFVAQDRQLWKSNGTEGDTVLVKNLGFDTYPNQLTGAGGTLFFTAGDELNGRELWKSDGTEAGTVLVKDINAGTDSYGEPLDSNARYLTNVNGTLFFTADDGIHGLELWMSDGTEAGTVLVKDIGPTNYNFGPRNLTDVNGTLFFTADDEINGLELWKSDGTEDGTVMVADINPGSGPYPYGPHGSVPGDLTNVNGTLFFTAFEETTGLAIWKSDGTEDGTALVKDIDPSTALYDGPFELTNVNGTLFFTEDDGTSGRELWMSDGTEDGTVIVKDIRPGDPPYSFSPQSLTNVNGTLFFVADDGTHGPEVWKSDGTERGTVLMKDINPDQGGVYGAGPADLTAVNGLLFFTADNGVHGRELWKSNGTPGGTTLVADIYPGDVGSAPRDLLDVNGTLFFTADDGFHGRELWRLDVITPQQQVDQLNDLLADLIVDGSLSKGQAKSLANKLDLKGNNGDDNRIKSFIKEVERLRRKGDLSAAEADQLLAGARRLLRLLEEA